ncbi:hypothetical protein LCGC14_0276300 [marine sediment metagenome]|uniref:Uncharacterized protein n=1 Tax=marine sediment metagenome TaxID=412755 RepID=A0A0F9UE39_9ZZZZ|nr:hypothetical protein [Phycisphaerae bacterium]HDZ43904.1 hypothetical protein [Phycisphaerae bacterium]
MTETDIERQIQALLCGELNEPDRIEALAKIATDRHARQVLAEMTALQQVSRRVFGIDRGAERMGSSITKVQQTIQAGALGESSGGTGAGGGGSRPPAPTKLWLGRVAAALLIATSVLAAVWSYRDANRAQSSVDAIRQELAEIRRTIETPPLAQADLAKYRLLWSHMQGAAGETAPWVVLYEGRGKFGAMAVVEHLDPDMIRLVRCFLVDDQARTVRTIDLLVPVGDDVRLTVPAAAEVAGMPIDMDLTSDGQWTSVQLSIGKNIAIRGRAETDRQPVELGRVRLNGRTLRVIVQAANVGVRA